MPQRSKILLIDDDKDFCAFVKSALEHTGRFEVLVSADGPSGIALAEAERPDLILLDIRMPQMDGLQVTDHLQHRHGTSDIPVAFVTGVLQKENVSTENGYIHGFPFITKTNIEDELVRQVDSVFDMIRTRKRFIEPLEEEMGAG